MHARGRIFLLRSVTEDIKVEGISMGGHCGAAHRRANKTIFIEGKRFPSHQLTSLSRIPLSGL